MIMRGDSGAARPSTYKWTGDRSQPGTPVRSTSKWMAESGDGDDRSGRVRRMYHALMYSVADDYLDRRGEFREEHLTLARAARARGELALAGAFTDPADSTLLVWSTADRAVVEAFVEQDPYVRNGLVTSWRIREWNVVVGGPDGP